MLFDPIDRKRCRAPESLGGESNRLIATQIDCTMSGARKAGRIRLTSEGGMDSVPATADTDFWTPEVSSERHRCALAISALRFAIWTCPRPAANCQPRFHTTPLQHHRCLDNVQIGLGKRTSGRALLPDLLGGFLVHLRPNAGAVDICPANQIAKPRHMARAHPAWTAVT
jgi:hypothetical protein